jgi:two-component system sensor histidine kinase UhpB
LHDQIGQTVTALSLGLKGLERMLTDSDDIAAAGRRAQVTGLQKLTVEIGRDLHRVAADLRPTTLDDLGLRRALATYAADWGERYGISVDVETLGCAGARLPVEAETAVYRVVQEALNNILKHARASRVSVIIEQQPNELRVVVEDDGQGFDSAAVAAEEVAASPSRRRLGLSGMRERMILNGGTIQIESSPGGGTALFVSIPLLVLTGEVHAI